MSHKYVFLGEDVHLGRFGQVRKGDVLELTEREHEHIKSDKRFKLFVEGEKTPKPPGLKLPDNFDEMTKPEQEKAVAAAEAAEKERLAALQNQNQKTDAENVDQMNKDQLLAFAKTLRDSGKTVEFKPDATKKQIKRAIKIALGQAQGNEGEGDDAGEE